MYGLVTITGPAYGLVTVEEAKEHLRIDHEDEDRLIGAWVRAASELAESYCGKRWITQTLRLTLAAWPTAVISGVCGAIPLPVEPVASVELLKYFDAGGTEVEIDAADYQTWLDHSPPLVCPGPQQSWPQLQSGKVKPVTVEFTAGTALNDVPEAVRTAIMLTLGNWDENRGDQNVLIARGLPPTAKFLLDQLWTGGYR